MEVSANDERGCIDKKEVEDNNLTASENAQGKNSSPAANLSIFGRLQERFSFMKYVILIIFLPPLLNYAALQRESIALVPKQGEKVDIGNGQKLYISCLGSGLPTVILIAPTGASSDIWYAIQEYLAKSTKICVYDRAGLGFSDLPRIAGSNERFQNGKEKYMADVSTLEQMNRNLHFLVTKAKPLPKPLIIVGSENGGLLARHYSLMYPEDISDIVLINPFVEDLFSRQKEEWHQYWNLYLLPSLQSLHLSAFVGISRVAALIGWLKPDIVGDFVPKIVEFRQLSHLCNPRHMSTLFNEHFAVNRSFTQMRELLEEKAFSINISVTVINSKKFEKIPTELYESWEQSQLHLRQNLHPYSNYSLFEGTLKELYNEPTFIAEKVKQLIFNWRKNFDGLTSHTYSYHEACPI